MNMGKNLTETLRGLKLLIFDVDGVFTDGSVYVNDRGEEMLKFSRIDGKGIGLVGKAGMQVAVISQENSKATRSRMEKLQIPEIHLGIEDKAKIYSELKQKYGLEDSEVAFCGDDVQDLELLKLVGFAACPHNAQDLVKAECDFVSQRSGAENFVREICNMILEIKS